jgi:hypothetical protein
MKGFNVFKWILAIIIPILLLSFLTWYYMEKKAYRIYILDKTVLNQKYSEHKSFNWILNSNRITKENGKPYSVSNDYYGFKPVRTRQPKEYQIKRLDLYEILSFSDDIDMVYYIDSYGVSYEDWYEKPADKLHSSLIYGGINQNDYLLLNEMKRKNKLIITEFNLLGSPTSDLNRHKIETLFDFYWTGWTGCYYRSLNIANPNIPGWITALYEKKYSKKWNFTGQGIIFVNENGNIVVLQNDIHLNSSYMKIVSGEYGKKEYGLPDYQYYSFWFDVINPGESNTVVASYQLDLTKQGKDELNKAMIPYNFPAVIEHLNDYKFYYLAGDFSDRDMFYSSSYFRGVSHVAKVFSLKNSNSKNSFFWRFYQPLVENILKKNMGN